MSEIHKFTLAYDAAEDRLAFDAEDSGGETTRLWLTERLCRNLAPALIKLLTEKGAAKATGAVAESTVQSWAQVAAMQGFGGTPAVKLKAQAPSGLVSAVHVTPTNGRFLVKFDFAGQSRSINFDEPALRQTLALMQRLYRQAGWPAEIWPDWIADPAVDAASGTVN
ncbi:hypothetical protein QO010_002757 [Caulobacter ginsengisoli]|uniref:Uncharacterized protein n=1 Tax=Caulobacter ginsengisoli TaxID=400775 RepID=A0ABU0ISI6_9CAUL|nr:hypothetical protein [Caulobacter ginsengisoli]MDQ0464973.1 hypothetical protein [Caulobacter ginsengisoli]